MNSRSPGQRVKAALDESEEAVARIEEAIRLTKAEVSRSMRLMNEIRAKWEKRPAKKDAAEDDPQPDPPAGQFTREP